MVPTGKRSKSALTHKAFAKKLHEIDVLINTRGQSYVDQLLSAMMDRIDYIFEVEVQVTRGQDDMDLSLRVSFHEDEENDADLVVGSGWDPSPKNKKESARSKRVRKAAESCLSQLIDIIYIFYWGQRAPHGDVRMKRDAMESTGWGDM